MIERLKSQLIQHEGLTLQPYLCSAGKKTIGIGWNMGAHPLPGVIGEYFAERGYIKIGMAHELLDISIGLALECCRKLYPGYETFGEERKIALADFVFNLGCAGAAKFINANALINERKWPEAAREMRNSKWFRQVGRRAVKITEMIRLG